MNVFLRFFTLAVFTVFLFSSCKTTAEYGERSLRKPMTSSEYVYHKKENKNSKTKSSRYSKKEESITKSVSKSVSYQQEFVVAEAENYKGTPYTYNGKNPKLGFDCSGFVSWVFTKAGYNLSGSSKSQAKMGSKINKNDIAAGDLVFFGENGKVSHVSIVKAVEGKNIYVIHATTSRGVVIDEINNSDYWGPKFLFARRILEEKEVAVN
jgi:lipoprotein Spr